MVKFYHPSFSRQPVKKDYRLDVFRKLNKLIDGTYLRMLQKTIRKIKMYNQQHTHKGEESAIKEGNSNKLSKETTVVNNQHNGQNSTIIPPTNPKVILYNAVKGLKPYLKAITLVVMKKLLQVDCSSNTTHGPIKDYKGQHEMETLWTNGLIDSIVTHHLASIELTLTNSAINQQPKQPMEMQQEQQQQKEFKEQLVLDQPQSNQSQQSKQQGEGKTEKVPQQPQQNEPINPLKIFIDKYLLANQSNQTILAQLIKTVRKAKSKNIVKREKQKVRNKMSQVTINEGQSNSFNKQKTQTNQSKEDYVLHIDNGYDNYVNKETTRKVRHVSSAKRPQGRMYGEKPNYAQKNKYIRKDRNNNQTQSKYQNKRFDQNRPRKQSNKWQRSEETNRNNQAGRSNVHSKESENRNHRNQSHSRHWQDHSERNNQKRQGSNRGGRGDYSSERRNQYSSQRPDYKKTTVATVDASKINANLRREESSIAQFQGTITYLD